MARISNLKASVSVAAFVLAFTSSGMLVHANDKELGTGILETAELTQQPSATLENIAMKRAATKASGGTIYEIGAGDKVRIKFFQRDELSGEYRVRADGNISLPLIGSVAVQGRTPVELEQMIATKFYEMTSRSAFAVVDVVERRPFFVAGDVNKPGTFQYVPRMTVVHAIAIAGGIYRMPQAANQIMDLTREQWRLRSAQADAAIQLAKRERLRAQLNSQDEIDFPEMLTELVGAQQAARIIRTQKRLFNQALTWRRSQESFLKSSLSLADEELKELKARLATMNETLKVHGADLNTTQNLFKRGLTQRRNVYQKKYAISNLETAAASVRAEIKRGELRRMQAAKGFAEFAPNESRKITVELNGIEDEFENSLRTIAASKSIIGQAMTPSGGLQNASFGGVKQKFTILRSVKGKITEIEAREHDRLLPGDVLRVALADSGANWSGGKTIEARSSAPASQAKTVHAKAPAAGITNQQTGILVSHLTDMKNILTAQSKKIEAFEKNQQALAREVSDWRGRYRDAVQEGLRRAVSDWHNQNIKIKQVKPVEQGQQQTNIIKSSTKFHDDLVPLPVKRPLEKVAKAAVEPRQRPTVVPVKLVKSLQAELQRVGCYSGQVDGQWGPLSRGAMARFGRYTNSSSYGSWPSMRAFLVVKNRRSGICKSRQIAQATRR